MTEIFDVIIIGGGPAGVTAGVYSARKQLRTLLITYDFGGQSIVSEYIENWIGKIKIKGSDLAKKLKEHVKYYESENFQIKEFTKVKNIQKKDDIFELELENGDKYFSKTVLVATGAKRRKLTIPGAKEFEHKGLTYCASCDGPMFTGKDVVVIGGGNAGFESASQLMKYCNSVTILQRDESFIAEKMMVDSVLSNKNVNGILNADIQEVFGDTFVNGIKYKDLKTGDEKELKVQGVFVEIGAIPATDFISNDLVEKDKFGQIIIDHKTGRSSLGGLWAAGDCSDSIYKQNTIAMGDATKAIEDLFVYLQK